MSEIIPANVPVEIFIARSVEQLRGLDLPVIAIVPKSKTWNDFGYKFYANLCVLAEDGEYFFEEIYIMFRGASNSEVEFNLLLTENGDVFKIEQLQKPFASLLSGVNHYKRVIELLGFEVGVSALRKMHDAVVTLTEGKNPQLLDLINSEEFHLGVLRNHGSYDALRRGGRFFRPDTPPQVDDAATNSVFVASLPSADNPYTLPFHFNHDSIFNSRTSVLIGRNGVGKTQLLKAIVDSLYSKNQTDHSHPHFQIPFCPSRVLVFSSVPADPFPHSIGAWHGIDYEYFSVNKSNIAKTDQLLVALVSCIKSSSYLNFGKFELQSRFTIVKKALKELKFFHSLYIPLLLQGNNDEIPYVIKLDGQKYFPINKIVNLGEQNSIRVIQQIDWSRSVSIFDDNLKIRDLSSGEYAMLRFAAQVSASIEQGSLLLLDEPETHLHPNFISDLMEILDNLLQSTNSVAIIATHSAYVVREVPRECVNVLTLKDREINIDTPRMQTFGATIDSISQFIFADTSISHRYQKTLTKWADQTGRELGIEGVINNYGKDLNSESLSFIARQLAKSPDEGPEPKETDAS